MKNLLSYASFIGLVSVVPACVEQSSQTTGGVAQPDTSILAGTGANTGALSTLATATCADPTFDGVSFASVESQHFVLEYLPNTQAQKDLNAISVRLENAYQAIRRDLQIEAEPQITVVLSPNRTAAVMRGLATGQAFPGDDREEVVYNGLPGSFEVEQVGNQLSRVLSYYVAPGEHLPILREGLAQYEDQSGRDLHLAFAAQVVAGAEGRGFDQLDVNGLNPGRAGSLVQAMIERYGMQRFLAVYDAASVHRDPASCDGWASAYGCIDSVETMTNALDGALQATEHESWSTVADAWKGSIDDAAANVDTSLPTADQSAIAGVVGTMERAVAAHDAAQYRSALEGYYCDDGGEAMRQDIASAQAASYDSPLDNILAIIDTGIKSFPSAVVKVKRLDGTVASLQVEATPAGWRLTGGDGWN